MPSSGLRYSSTCGVGARRPGALAREGGGQGKEIDAHTLAQEGLLWAQSHRSHTVQPCKYGTVTLWGRRTHKTSMPFHPLGPGITVPQMVLCVKHKAPYQVLKGYKRKFKGHPHCPQRKYHSIWGEHKLILGGTMWSQNNKDC